MFLRHYFLVILIMFLFGSAYPLGKIALNTSIPPILMSSLRMGLVFICLIPFWKFKMPDKKDIFPLVLFSLVMGVGVNLFMNLSLLKANIVSTVIIGSQLSIPFGLLASSLILKEKLSKKKWLLTSLIFIGILIFAFDPHLKNEILAMLLVSVMAIFYACANIISRYLKSLKVTLTNSFMGFLGCIILFIISFFVEGNTINHLNNIDYVTWFLIGYSAILVSIFGHMSMFHLLKFYPVPKTLPFYSLFPIFGLIQSYFIFNEKPTALMILGGLIVIISIYFINRTD